jgi:hypothetical protein
MHDAKMKGENQQPESVTISFVFISALVNPIENYYKQGSRPRAARARNVDLEAGGAACCSDPSRIDEAMSLYRYPLSTGETRT